MEINQEIFAEYAKLKIQEKEIAKRIKELNPLIVANMQELGVEKVPSDIGSFNLSSKKKWVYTPEAQARIENLEQQIEEIQTNEKADGRATFEEVPELKFFIKKEKTNDEV